LYTRTGRMEHTRSSWTLYLTLYGIERRSFGLHFYAMPAGGCRWVLRPCGSRSGRDAVCPHWDSSSPPRGDWVEDGAGRMEILMTVSKFASFCTMGANASALEKEIGSEQFPVNEHYFGLVNFGNTCYCNSVLQALYFCRPFREKILAYRSQPRRKENLLTCLADLFHSIANQKRKVGVIPPKKFITRLRKENVNNGSV
ncbi:hypothetical protein cypCar_00000080, partial [Cyprinus carpio]